MRDKIIVTIMVSLMYMVICWVMTLNEGSKINDPYTLCHPYVALFTILCGVLVFMLVKEEKPVEKESPITKEEQEILNELRTKP